MKFASVDGKKLEAAKGLKGICAICSSELTAKCGNVRINHWAHKGTHNCDPWWENETEWHRAWKNNFPIEWQETILTDAQTGEKHIADVRTSHGLVLEFQHSHLNPEEREKREAFYKNMVWVIDGTRLTKDYPRFLKGAEFFRKTDTKGVFLIDSVHACFPPAWLASSTPVIFDFRGLEVIKGQKDLRHFIYCVFPKTDQKERIVAVLTRESFVDVVRNGRWFKKQDEPQIQPPITAPPNQSIIPKPSSQYVLHRGRFVRRRRF